MADGEGGPEARAYTPAEIINADETGIFYGAPPLNQYVPHDAARGTAPESDEKARYTALLAGNGAGEMLPGFYIIKNTVDKPDQSGSTVVKTLFQTEGSGFTAADGFELKVWERTLELPPPRNKRKKAGDSTVPQV